MYFLALSHAPPPDVIEELDFETIYAARKADFLGRFPAFSADVESDPVIKALEAGAYRELVLRARINDAVRGVLIASIYAPNGNPQPGPKFDYKLARLERMRKHATNLRKTGAPVVLAGDFNVAPGALDIYPTKSWDDDALVHPQSRAAFRKLVGRSWVDALRRFHSNERIYTFWHYKRQRWQRDAGLRLRARAFAALSRPNGS